MTGIQWFIILRAHIGLTKSSLIANHSCETVPHTHHAPARSAHFICKMRIWLHRASETQHEDSIISFIELNSRCVKRKKEFHLTLKMCNIYISISCLVLPVLTPPVNIQAPVVMAALMSPLPKTCLSLGCNSKFWRPPWTEMSSLGSSSCHSLVIRWSSRSGLVS